MNDKTSPRFKVGEEILAPFIDPAGSQCFFKVTIVGIRNVGFWRYYIRLQSKVFECDENKLKTEEQYDEEFPVSIEDDYEPDNRIYISKS